ncbi:MAG: aminotransferase class V-fold PLP-dependent enzyme, partial [Halomonas sp.]|nr:aminotransferase class V-fold PLP-dependent enzyme [Halomonas sp.]
IHGGGHERGMRSGTLPTHQIAGMGQAFVIAEQEGEADQARIAELAARFLAGLEGIPGIHRNTDTRVAVPNILNLAFDGVDGESLLMALRGIAVSTGSACNSASVEPSYVLKGIGVPRSRALTSLRFSFGRFTTEAEIDAAVAELRHALTTLQR